MARRDKKAFFNEQCKEIVENNRKGKSRDLQENWRYQRNISYKDRHDKVQKQQRPNISRRDQDEMSRIQRRTVQKILMSWITMIVWSLT